MSELEVLRERVAKFEVFGREALDYLGDPKGISQSSQDNLYDHLYEIMKESKK